MATYYNIAYSNKGLSFPTFILGILDVEMSSFVSKYNYGYPDYFIHGKTYNLKGIDEIHIYDTSKAPTILVDEIETFAKKELGRHFDYSIDDIISVLSRLGKKVTNDFIKKPYANAVPRIASSMVSSILTKQASHDMSKLHPIVIKTVGELFNNGHYRQAILDTYIALIENVKRKSKLDIDGSPLMDKAFSPKMPILRISMDPEEQLGFMMLFKGAVMGVRNPKAHKLIDQKDPQRTLEWLSFASVLFRVLDDASVEL